MSSKRTQPARSAAYNRYSAGTRGRHGTLVRRIPRGARCGSHCASLANQVKLLYDDGDDWTGKALYVLKLGAGRYRGDIGEIYGRYRGDITAIYVLKLGADAH